MFNLCRQFSWKLLQFHLMCETCTALISEAFANQRKQSNFQLLNPMILRWTRAEMWREVLARVEQLYALLAVIRLSCCICRFVWIVDQEAGRVVMLWRKKLGSFWADWWVSGQKIWPKDGLVILHDVWNVPLHFQKSWWLHPVWIPYGLCWTISPKTPIVLCILVKF